MKIGVFSDLHLEFRNNKIAVTEICDKLQAAAAKVDLMVNAGDTHPNPLAREYVKNLFEPGQYIDILGNHDSYRDQWKDGGPEVVYKDNTMFVVGTLWTNFSDNALAAMAAERQIADFSQIAGASKEKMITACAKMVDQIGIMCPDVVISHFAPHRGSTHPRYAAEPLNPYFVNNLDELIVRVKPKLWIHGHVHDPFDYIVDKTRVVCNPLGYPGETYAQVADYEVLIVEI